jgi:hypothetical protein
MNGDFNQSDHDHFVDILSPVLQCSGDDPNNDKALCNVFAGKALEAFYGNTDFKTDDGYMQAEGMFEAMQTSQHWHENGSILDQDANLCAQALVNQGHPTLAIMAAPAPGKHGHVAVIIPGVPLNAPNFGIQSADSASFLMGNPAGSYVDGPLSKSFLKSNGDAGNAFFYYRD